MILWNSIGTKILLLILVFSLLQGWFFMVDVVLILMVLNVGGALIVSRFLTRK
ncbi:MAG TPA: monovalent cation/H+ antiporter complex subunit F [Thermotogota bacterium]|nr:monovalent cation/H+ antiporter complex subunit F [Thermotogota bacterium]HRW92464.1 monovalent cation/H+ antiporter complex subunit F [Thermotogota bacterium]